MMDGRITRLVCTATVVTHAGDESRREALAQGLLRTALPAALPGALEHALGDDPTVYVARSLHCEVSAGPAATAATLARSIAAQLARALRAPDRDSTGLARFPSTADYLAAFLAALARGDAWQRWYFHPLRRLAHLEPPAVFRALDAEGHEMGHVLLALHRSGELGRVVSAVGEEALARCWPSSRHTRPRQAEWLSLVRIALDLARVLGWDVMERQDPQVVAAELADRADGDLDWSDPVALAQALARAVRLVARPAAAAGEVAAGQLPGWLDWADSDTLVAALPARPQPTLPPGAPAGPPGAPAGPPRTLAVEAALARIISSGTVVLDRRHPVTGSVTLWAALIERMPELAEAPWARDAVSRFADHQLASADSDTLVAGLPARPQRALPPGAPAGPPRTLAVEAALARIISSGTVVLDRRHPVTGSVTLWAALIERMPELAEAPWARDAVSRFADHQLASADSDTLVAGLPARPQRALPPGAPAGPPRTLAVEAALARIISSGTVVLDRRHPVTGSVTLWAALIERMPELAEAPWARDAVSRFADHQLASADRTARAGHTAAGAAIPVGLAQPPATADVQCAGVYLLLRTLDAIRMPRLCQRTGVPAGLLLPMLARRWAGPDASSDDVAAALLPILGDRAARRTSLTAGALPRLQAEVARAVLAQHPSGGGVLRLRAVPFGATAMAMILGDADDLMWPGGQLQGPGGASGALPEWWQEVTGEPAAQVEHVPGDADDPGRAVLLAGLAAMAHAHSGDPEIDLPLDLIALTVLRHWARWLRGFSAASVPYLLATFIRRPGRLIAADNGTLQVRLKRLPHDVVLDVSGCLAPFDLRWPWLPQAGPDVTAASAAGPAAGQARRIDFTMGT